MNPLETSQTWNKLASLYQDKFMDLTLYNHTYDYICNSINQPNAKLLDVGCGPGNVIKYLLSKRPDFDMLGLDIAPNMIALAKKNNPTAKFKVMDCRHINTLNQQFDGIIAGFCLPYLSPAETNELISNAYGLLNPNGFVYLSFVEGNANQSGFKDSGSGRVYFFYHQLNHLKQQLTNANFYGLHTFDVNYKKSETELEVHTILVAKKKIGTI